MNDFDKELARMMGTESFSDGTESLPERHDGDTNPAFKTKFPDEQEIFSVDGMTEDEERKLRFEALLLSQEISAPTSTQAEIIEGEEKFDEDDIEAELAMIMSNQKEVREIDLSKDLPTLERATVQEFILIEGDYTSLFIDYINNHRHVPEGTIPLAVLSDKGPLVVRDIQATPDILYNMQYFLHGFKFFLVSDGEKTPLDIYYFLGKIPLLEKANEESTDGDSLPEQGQEQEQT